MADYKAVVTHSTKELTARDKLKLTQLSSAIGLDEVIPDENGATFVIEGITDYAIVEVHNEKSDNKDYKKILIITEGGLYSTGSESFAKEFTNIYDVMTDDCAERGEPTNFGIECYRRESKNYKGKTFITCTIL